ncbi:hypothetical protein C1I95_19320 [Micromonospora craterilacus]|uniref:Uncharacterized protein n=1 Tax=Micromonospora craterilacus TaxID=1655439 RepID=A0A2W2F1S4_9ACTN|nr:hypothetical protein [Micromonospora craterilacus]PZG15557.1 hypothetical protein C1I95_19320 [Micromonospora craterilacus]
MSQSELERAVREAFSRRTAASRAPADDPAGAVIRRANRIQRRRALAGMSLVAVAIVGVSAGAMQLGDDPPPSNSVVVGEPDPVPDAAWTTVAPPTGPDTETPLAEVDLVLGETIATAQGRRVSVLGAGGVERAHRLADGRGWLAIGTPTPSGRFLWAVTPNGAAQVLLAGADEIVLDQHGQQVAWKQGAMLAAAGIANGELTGTVRADAPAEAVPLRFVDGAVLVRLAPDRPGHVLWQRRPGPLDPGTDRSSTRVFGALPDGRLVGEVATGTPRRACLALLDPTQDLAPAGPECGPELGGDGPGAVSPDGRWLLVNGQSKGQDAALLVDLAGLGSSAVPQVAGPTMTGTVVWNALGTAYYADTAGGLVRVDVDRIRISRPAAPVAVPGLKPGESPVVVSGG